MRAATGNGTQPQLPSRCPEPVLPPLVFEVHIHRQTVLMLRATRPGYPDTPAPQPDFPLFGWRADAGGDGIAPTPVIRDIEDTSDSRRDVGVDA